MKNMKRFLAFRNGSMYGDGKYDGLWIRKI